MAGSNSPESKTTLLSTLAKPFIEIKNYFTGWQGWVNFFDFLAHLANLIGVGSHFIISWVPLLKNTIEMLGVADPLIYCFRTAEKIFRYVGRNYFKVTFDEEKYNTHQWQNKADIGTILLFAAAIVLFFAGSFPFHLSLAWFLGLVGVSINGYFDHRCPEIFAKKAYDENSQHNATIFEDYLKKYYSTRLYFALIFSLVLLLILGSAVGPALPLALHSSFDFVAKLGSVFLVLCNFARFINTCSPLILYRWHQRIHGIFSCCSEPPREKVDEQSSSSRLRFTRSSSNLIAKTLSKTTSPQKATPPTTSLLSKKIFPALFDSKSSCRTPSQEDIRSRPCIIL